MLFEERRTTAPDGTVSEPDISLYCSAEFWLSEGTIGRFMCSHIILLGGFKFMMVTFEFLRSSKSVR